MGKRQFLPIIAIGLLIWALNDNPYGYYQILRIVITGIAGYLSYLFWEGDNDTSWTWIMGIVAILFNPIFPIYLDRSMWAVVDAIVAGVFFVSIFRPKEAERAQSGN